MHCVFVPFFRFKTRAKCTLGEPLLLQKVLETDNLNGKREIKRNNPKMRVSYVHVAISQIWGISGAVPLWLVPNLNAPSSGDDLQSKSAIVLRSDFLRVNRKTTYIE